MSGGHFHYNQDRIRDIAEEIELLIASNNDKTEDSYGQPIGYGYSKETIDRFNEAVHALYQASEMARRVDWLVSGDDGEDCFHKRWTNEVRPYWNEINNQKNK